MEQLAQATWQLKTSVLLACVSLKMLCLLVLPHSPAAVQPRQSTQCSSRNSLPNKLEQNRRGTQLQQSPLKQPQQPPRRQQQQCVKMVVSRPSMLAAGPGVLLLGLVPHSWGPPVRALSW
jgi:hypothetical protein